MTLIEDIQHGLSGGAAPETVVLEMTPRGGVVLSVVRLEHQQVVGLAIQNPLGDILLTTHGIERHQGIFQHQTVQQLGNGRDLVGLIVHAPLAHALTQCSGDC